MGLSKQFLSIADFRRLGAFEIYNEAEVVAFAKGKNVSAKKAATAQVSDDVSFRLGELFASPTKFRRLLWLARRPGVLPESLMRRFAYQVATRCLQRLSEEGELSDIRLTASMNGLQSYIEGMRHLRSLSPLHDSATQASLDHMEHSTIRAADGCRAVVAALNCNAYEAGAESAHCYLDLFPDPDSERWLRSCLNDLINQFE